MTKKFKKVTKKSELSPYMRRKAKLQKEADIISRVKDLSDNLDNAKDNLDDLRDLWSDMDSLEVDVMSLDGDNEKFSRIQEAFKSIKDFVGNIPFPDDVDSDIQDLSDVMLEIEDEKEEEQDD